MREASLRGRGFPRAQRVLRKFWVAFLLREQRDRSPTPTCVPFHRSYSKGPARLSPLRMQGPGQDLRRARATIAVLREQCEVQARARQAETQREYRRHVDRT